MPCKSIPTRRLERLEAAPRYHPLSQHRLSSSPLVMAICCVVEKKLLTSAISLGGKVTQSTLACNASNVSLDESYASRRLSLDLAGAKKY